MKTTTSQAAAVLQPRSASRSFSDPHFLPYNPNMNPRLVAIAGPLKGTTFTLTEEDLSIGREASNRLSISDLALSRRHCLVKKDAENFKLCDLDSLNGTFVGGVPIKERLLEDGDQIKLGDSLFLFLLREEEVSPTSSSVQLVEGRLLTHSTIELRIEDALYLQPEKVLSTLPATVRMARDLKALLKISMAINSIRSMEVLEQQLLELIFEFVPAQRGAILFAGDGLELASVFGWERLSGPEKSVQVSRTIVDKVLREGAAILSNDITESEAFSAAKSLTDSHIRSLLCVPLVVYERVLDAIYLDTSDPAARFDEDHLQLLAAIAGIAAVAMENIRRLEWLEGENRRLQDDINIEHNMVGESQRMREVYQFITKVAPTDSTVLIGGESGTGKELAARAIHNNSKRADKPFVAINCAALTETLLESELFGHEKGAFTGAIAQKKGKLEVADGGTLFLDEVAELAPVLQAKLLRVLQEREFERVGGTRPIKANIRLIAATNKDLKEAIGRGAFRQDLYYWLNVVSLTMPPLSERREDILLLASYFTAKHSRKCKRQVMGISQQARSCLARYDWPGNVRELENAIERAVVLGSTEFILLEDLPEAMLDAGQPIDLPINRYHEAVKELKKQLIQKAVEQANGNYTEAAKLLGVHPNYLHRLIRNMDLKTELKN
jgi:transcriptional regulator with GAF, ATPase, and Fis domain